MPIEKKELDLIDIDEIQDLINKLEVDTKVSENNNINLKLSIKEARELNRKLDARTKWGVLLGFVGTIATVLAFLLSHQAMLINTLNLKMKSTETKIESMEKWRVNTDKNLDSINRRIGRRIGDEGSNQEQE